MIAAILRAQFLSMRLGARRGVVLSLVTGIAWYGLWVAIAAVAMFSCAYAGPALLQKSLPIGLLAVFVYWQVVPIVSVSMGSSLDMRKLMVYPVPHRRLFAVEILLRLASGIEMILAIAGGMAGLLANRQCGGWKAAPGIAAAALVFVLFNLLLASGLRSLLERLLSRRKVREVIVLAMLMLWMLPRLMSAMGVHLARFRSTLAVMAAAGLPWAAAARIALGPTGPVSWLSLLGWTVAAALFGRAQFERSLRFDTLAAQATEMRPVSRDKPSPLERFYRFPSRLWRDPLAAVVEKELRSLARSPRFRTVFIMGFTFGLMVWLPMVVGSERARHATMSRYFLPIVCIYALTLLGQVTYWNCFGFDRSACVFYFAAPQPLRRTLIGKNIASLIYIYLEIAILTGVTAALRMLGGWAQAIETLAVVTVCAVYMLGLGNVASVEYPRGLNPERVSQGGASSRFQALTFLLYPLALLPVFLAYLARYAFESQLAFDVVLAIAAAVAVIVYVVALDSAANSAYRRREAILQELSASEGPVVSQ